jgi:hypothetical protein
MNGRFSVGIGDEAMDRIFEVLHGAKDPALEATLGELEQTFDGVEPGREVGVKWKTKRG